MTLADSDKITRKELDEIKGIPAYPTVAEFAGWKRETRYAVCAASVKPQRTLQYLSEAEDSTTELLQRKIRPEFETLEAKFAKDIRQILRGDIKREISNLEETVF